MTSNEQSTTLGTQWATPPILPNQIGPTQNQLVPRLKCILPFNECLEPTNKLKRP